jgi:hypothetical protein
MIQDIILYIMGLANNIPTAKAKTECKGNAKRNKTGHISLSFSENCPTGQKNTSPPIVKQSSTKFDDRNTFRFDFQENIPTHIKKQEY